MMLTFISRLQRLRHASRQWVKRHINVCWPAHMMFMYVVTARRYEHCRDKMRRFGDRTQVQPQLRADLPLRPRWVTRPDVAVGQMIRPILVAPNPLNPKP